MRPAEFREIKRLPLKYAGFYSRENVILVITLTNHSRFSLSVGLRPWQLRITVFPVTRPTCYTVNSTHPRHKNFPDPGSLFLKSKLNPKRLITPIPTTFIQSITSDITTSHIPQNQNSQHIAKIPPFPPPFPLPTSAPVLSSPKTPAPPSFS
jgi:hypothetical protein